MHAIHENSEIYASRKFGAILSTLLAIIIVQWNLYNYSGHPSEAAKWLLYTDGLLIDLEVFNVYVAHEKFRWDFPYWPPYAR